jgi:alanine-synthesizing transaminase
MSSPVLSRRIRDLEGPMNPWSVAAGALRASGRDCLDLTVSNPTTALLNCDWQQVRSTLAAASVRSYLPNSLGNRESREHIAAYLRQARPPNEHGFFDVGQGAPYDGSRMMFTASTSESYSYLFKLLCDPGDCIAIPAPSYPLLDHLASLESLKVVSYDLAYDGAWHVDLDSMRRALSHRPKLIIVVSPNNPTASCIRVEEYRYLRSMGLPIVVDQVFAPYTVASRDCQSLPFHEEDGLVFVLDGLSKRCALPQLKLGWISVFGDPTSSTKALAGLELIGDTYLSVNAIAEQVAPRLLQQTEEWRNEICRRLTSNRGLLQRQLVDAPVSMLHYQGGWTALLRLPAYHSDDEWATRLTELGVIVQPGWLYDCSLPATIAISLLTPEDTLSAALERIVHLAD